MRNLGTISASLLGLMLLMFAACNDNSSTDPAEEEQPPAAPTDLTVVYNRPDIRNELSWTDNSDNEVGFVILHSVDNMPWEVLADRDHNSTTHIDHSVSEATIYSYKVFAYNDMFNSDTTDSVGLETPLNGPVDFSTYVRRNPDGIEMGWSDRSGREDGFYIQRKDGESGEWAPLIGTEENDVTYLDQVNLVPDTTYYYRVYAWVFTRNMIVYSDTSDVSATTWTEP